MIKACLVYHNEIGNLPRMVESLQNFDIPLIAIDGAVIGCPTAQTPYSNDGSTEYLQSVGATVVQTSHYYLNQAHKRNEYLRLLEDGDQFLVIDADEELVEFNPWEGIIANALLKFQNEKNEHVMAPRLVTYKYPMQYVTHWLIYMGKDPYLDLSFVKQTMNRPIDKPYNAVINNYRQDRQAHIDWKVQHRTIEILTTKLL